MPKTFTLDGKRHRIAPAVPQGQIRELVGRYHVATSDEQIEADMAARCAAWGWPDKETEQAKKFALSVHRENQGLYRSVMGGHVG